MEKEKEKVEKAGVEKKEKKDENSGNGSLSHRGRSRSRNAVDKLKDGKMFVKREKRGRKRSEFILLIDFFFL